MLKSPKEINKSRIARLQVEHQRLNDQAAQAPYSKNIDPMTGLFLQFIQDGKLSEAIAQFKSYAWFYSQFPTYPSYVTAIFSLAIRQQDAKALKDFTSFFYNINHSPSVLEHLPFIVDKKAWPVLYTLIESGVIAINFPFVGGRQYGYLEKDSLLLDKLNSLQCPKEVILILKHRFNAVCEQDMQNFELAKKGAWAALQFNFDHDLVDVNAQDIVPNKEGQLGLTISDYAYLAKQYAFAYQSYSEKNRVNVNRLVRPIPIRPVAVQKITADAEDKQKDNRQDEYSLGLVELLERLAITKPSPYVSGYPPHQRRGAVKPTDVSSLTQEYKGPRKRFD